ncbi:MAG: hypothetical protein U0794_12665 [Isosphaeraceae bacterium]
MVLRFLARPLVLGLLVSLVGSAHAQAPRRGADRFPPPPGRRGAPDGPEGRPPGPPIIAAIDKDRDGSLSAEEIKNAAEALLTLDRNNDGKLDRSELDPAGQDGPPRDRPEGRPGLRGPGGPPEGFEPQPPGGPLGPGRRGVRGQGPPREGPGGPGGPPPRRDLDGRLGGSDRPGAPPREGRPEVGRFFPPGAAEALNLSEKQAKQIAELENDVRAKLETILTAEQKRELQTILERGPGGGPGGFAPPGGPSRSRTRAGFRTGWASPGWPSSGRS